MASILHRIIAPVSGPVCRQQPIVKTD